MANREQPIRDALAGVFATTPLTLHIYLGGTPETFDAKARFMMEWHLRTLGYQECTVYPSGALPQRVHWHRSQHTRDLWPEDARYMEPDAESDPIIEAVMRRCAEAELRRVGKYADEP
ncbi:hypothetical protein [Xanthobacter versatilis]|uniref:hypothetical protein n=1 Tax=Xanthobacter autotrophicus (strain ATCC BAA-1158 / Py2) TaxID=78245 RepID=UPI0037298289